MLSCLKVTNYLHESELALNYMTKSQLISRHNLMHVSPSVLSYMPEAEKFQFSTSFLILVKLGYDVNPDGKSNESEKRKCKWYVLL